ncbi:MAG: FAD-dependent oxidoreductase [Desulfomonile tiedjei]|nr:FAD-dependent oxidoreductase [Desulfomonile tiedjei]
MEHFSYDVLVLGSGAAGLRAAIAAREAGLGVCVVSKGSPGKSTCTGVSAGVMAGSVDAGATHAHLERTLQSGRGINQRELAEVLVSEAPLRLDELRRWGISGEFRNGYLFSGGRAPVQGEALVHCLLKKAQELGAQFMGNLLATDLVMEGGSAGITAYSQASGTWIAITAKAAVLATGGAAALYLRNDNPKRMLGEGYRLALGAGAVLQDLEFVQFYPLCLAEAGLAPLVIPPRLADCGRLMNELGEDLLEKHGIQERPAGERARDRLSQGLFTEMYRNGHEALLDLSNLTDEQWRIDPFSASMSHLLGENCGAMSRPVRVAPAAHHTMGGVSINRAGETSVQGLFAAGEVTGGLHGANRMGGNALSETLVFGARAGSSAADWAKHGSDKHWRSILTRLTDRRESKETAKPTVAELRKRLREIMWQDGGIIRNREGLIRASEAVQEIREEVGEAAAGQEGSDLASTLELSSATRVAGLILDGALRRQESRGAHCREDFPEQDDDKWRGHLQVHINANGEDVWKFEPNLPS